jgi:hypothetical protein
MIRKVAYIALGCAWLLTLAGGASAANSCVVGANTDFKACTAGCRQDHADEVDICRGHDPVCAQTCRDGRDECSDPIIQTDLTDCLNQCPGLDQARADCKAQVGCGGQANPCGFNPAYISCLNPAQAASFNCRNACQDAFRLNVDAQSALKACEDSFKTCVKGCPPPTTN